MHDRIEAIPTTRPAQWQQALDAAGEHDFYHTSSYHALAESRGEGDGVLLSWGGRSGSVALPLMLRPLSRIPVFSAGHDRWKDATSVYGYGGPVGALDAEDERAAFGHSLNEWLTSQSVVSVFSRLHPLLDQTVICGLGEIATLGQTVSIDLARSPDEQIAGYRSNHRRDLRKLRTAGFTCRLASDADGIADFERLYLETMLRVDAADAYFFDRAYFECLLQVPGVDLMLCELTGRPYAGAIIARYGGIAQYHLGGTSNDALAHAPMKLVFDELRRMSHESGCRRLHLGGGLGAQEDPLFLFKAGFSSDRHDFSVWRWRVDEERYAEFAAKAGSDERDGFFPTYAAPVSR